ncbi:cytochrome P450 [Streptomyces roseirectus]|uniref:Cytochrome P450 n=1 Tax=Streptomyces roseirectus TaxID=2768066 RepID=A0A7H0I5G5_9ACTN|nr:cytochrome P450 [Streptomyces roseirectus]QNP68031.1 cytochrome P450 [Streptomyces roseirectus]
MPLEMETPLPYQRDQRCPYDPSPALRHAQREEPVTRYRMADGRDIWVVTRYDDVRDVLTDDRLSSALTPLTLMVPGVDDTGLEISPGSFVNMDPPHHTRLRRTVAGGFTARRMRELTPRLEQIAETCLDDLERKGPGTDFLTAFANPFPLLAICELLGLTDDQRADYLALTERAPGLAATEEEALSLVADAHRFMSDVVTAQRAHPGDGMIGMLARDHGDDLTDAEIVGIANMHLTAGYDTVAATLGLGLLALLDHPDQFALLRDDPAVLDTAVDELMRYLSVISATGGRTATEDIELRGVTIKKGEYVVPALAAANRDPDHFPDPDRLDLTRPQSQQVGFGHGLHRCPGAAMTLIEMKVGFTALLRRFPTIRLAVPREEIAFRGYNMVHGALAIPVAW